MALSFDIPGLKVILPPTEYLSFTVSGVAYHGSNYPEPWNGVVSPAIAWRIQRLAGRERLPAEFAAKLEAEK